MKRFVLSETESVRGVFGPHSQNGWQFDSEMFRKMKKTIPERKMKNGLFVFMANNFTVKLCNHHDNFDFECQILSLLRKVFIRRKFWAKVLLFSILLYPNLKVGVIDNQVITGL